MNEVNTLLVEDSLRIHEGALIRHRVEVVREFEPVRPMNVEKHKLLHILVNLPRNAKQACQESDRTDRRLTVRIANGDGRITLELPGQPAAAPDNCSDHQS